MPVMSTTLANVLMAIMFVCFLVWALTELDDEVRKKLGARAIAVAAGISGRSRAKLLSASAARLRLSISGVRVLAGSSRLSSSGTSTGSLSAIQSPLRH